MEINIKTYMCSIKKQTRKDRTELLRHKLNFSESWIPWWSKVLANSYHVADITLIKSCF